MIAKAVAYYLKFRVHNVLSVTTAWDTIVNEQPFNDILSCFITSCDILACSSVRPEAFDPVKGVCAITAVMLE